MAEKKLNKTAAQLNLILDNIDVQEGDLDINVVIGSGNSIENTTGVRSSIILGGGYSVWPNTITGANARYCSILGGYDNQIVGAISSFILAGTHNSITTGVGGHCIAIGNNNVIDTSGTASGTDIIIGNENNIIGGTSYAFIIGTGCEMGSADYSAAFGRKSKITAIGAMQFSDGIDAVKENSVQNSVKFNFTGGFRFIGGNFGVGVETPTSKVHLADEAAKSYEWSDPNPALIHIGSPNVGSSIFINTPSVSAGFPSGFAIDGSYAASISTVKIGAYGVKSAGTDYGSTLKFITTKSNTENEVMRMNRHQCVSIGGMEPTAILHLKAGTAAAGTAPFKLTAGVNLTTPEAGAVEWDGTNLFVTQSDGTRKTIAYTA